jgi:arylformamidase
VKLRPANVWGWKEDRRYAILSLPMPMKITFDTGGTVREYNLAHPIDISIPLRFDGPQPNAYGVERASSRACEYGTLIGDTRRGGSCNFEQYTFIPHCNGTHTECVGHIANERLAIRECLRDVVIPARLISVGPVNANETDEHYSLEFGPHDRLITKAILAAAFDSASRPASSGNIAAALIVRTLPNDDRKLTRCYNESDLPPYFTTEAMQYLAELGCKHLLVDLPSIDRLFDEGKLQNHRIFWNVEERSFEVNPETRTANTVTELIYVPNEVPDGEYLLNLQIAPFAADCAPSRPILFGAPPSGGRAC